MTLKLRGTLKFSIQTNLILTYNRYFYYTNINIMFKVHFRINLYEPKGVTKITILYNHNMFRRIYPEMNI